MTDQAKPLSGITDKNELHHWSGWPGAFCFKCGGSDPVEEAYAAGELIDDVDPDDPSFGQGRTPEIQARVQAACVCPVKGTLVWNTARVSWDLKKPDGEVVPFFKDNMGQSKT